MLVLKRRVGEAIRIGDEIRIYVVAIQGDRVKLSFEAPPDVPVHREEVYHRIQRELGR